MTTLSTRYVLPLTVLLIVALPPVWIHSCGGFRSDDCLHPSALLETSWIAADQRPEELDDRTLDGIFQVVRASVATRAPGMSHLEFRIFRSFDPQRLYRDPVTFLGKAHEFSSAQPVLEWIEVDAGELPIRTVLAWSSSRVRIGSYMFLYDSKPVADPFRASISAVPRRVVTGPRPLTLLAASVNVEPARRAGGERLAKELLIEAWEYYRSVCW